jgi:phage baseplate assembly protein W
MPARPQDREFLGTGLAFPLQVNPRGEIALVSGERDITQAIRIILETIPGERVMRPEFGCRAKELVFAPRNAATTTLMDYYVRRALGQWEPRIDVHNVRVYDDPGHDGGLLVEISYLVRDTHSERSIVHPFYIASEEGG